MSEESDLKRLYLAFEAVRSDPQLAAVLGTLISTLGARLHPLGQEQIGEFSIGSIIYRADLSDRFGRACIYGGRQERDDLELFLGLCNAGSVVWDIGANFGLYAVAAADKAGPSGMIFAAEPSVRAMTLLNDNAERNATGAPLRLFSCAVADFDGTATFYEAQETAFSGLSDTRRSAISAAMPTEVHRLDTLWQATGNRAIDLIKIDVEGHEADVLIGGREAIAASPQAIVQFEISPKNLDEARQKKLLAILRALQEEQMGLWYLDGAARRFTQVPIIKGELPKEISGNIFMVRRGSDREERLMDLAHQLVTRPPVAATELEQALAFTLSLLNARSQNKSLRDLNEINNLRDALMQRPRTRPALGQRFRPFALASVKTVTAVIRVTAEGQDIAAAAQSAIDFCAGRPVSLIVADGRAKGGPLDYRLEATVISPAPGLPQRYGHSVLAALRAVQTSHALLLDADGVLLGSLEDAEQRWWQKVSRGERVVGLAFAYRGPDTADQPMQEETLGGMLALRYGLLAVEPLRRLAYTLGSFAGDGFDLDLSLSLWHAGLTLADAPASICFQSRREGPRPAHYEADQAHLEDRWTGTFAHPAVPSLFKKGRLRPVLDD